MYKIQIQARCAKCGGKAYVDPYEVVHESGESYTRYRACAYCLGTGDQTKWVTLPEFLDLINEEVDAERMVGGTT